MATLETIGKVNGATDVMAFDPAIAFKREIDFSVSNVSSGEAVELIPVPKGFIVTGIYVEEKSTASAGTLTLKTKINSAVIGASSGYTVGGSTALKTFSSVASTLVDNNIVCVTAGADMTEGVVAVTLYGYTTDADKSTFLNPIEAARPALQTESQAAENVSGGDLLNPVA